MEQGNQCVKPGQSCYREGKLMLLLIAFLSRKTCLICGLRRFVVNLQRIERYESKCDKTLRFRSETGVEDLAQAA